MTKFSRAASTTAPSHGPVCWSTEYAPLGQESVQQAEVPAGHPHDGGDDLVLQRLGRWQGDAWWRPASFQQLAHLRGAQGPEFVNETNPAVELTIASQPFLQPGHPETLN